MGDVTELLDRWSQGDAEAFKSLIPLVYDELHAWRPTTCARSGPDTPCSRRPWSTRPICG